MPNSSHSLRLTSDSSSADDRAAPADAVGDVAVLLPPPAAALASLMRAAYSALHLDALQRLPASACPLEPKQMTHEATILRVLRERSDNGLNRLLESLSPHRLLESTTWTFGNVDMSGYVWICLDIWTVWTCLDISVLTVA